MANGVEAVNYGMLNKLTITTFQLPRNNLYNKDFGRQTTSLNHPTIFTCKEEQFISKSLVVVAAFEMILYVKVRKKNTIC